LVSFVRTRNPQKHSACSAGKGRGSDLVSANVCESLLKLTNSPQPHLNFQTHRHLVCHAGFGRSAPVEEVTADSGTADDINPQGPLGGLPSRDSADDEQRSGTIVIVTSNAGQRGEGYLLQLWRLRGWSIAFTQVVADELGSWNDNVNAVRSGLGPTG